MPAPALLVPLLISAGVGAATTAAKAAPTAADNSNRRRLQELKRRQAAGQLGLSPGKQAHLQAQLTDPVRQQQRDLLAQQAALAATSGQTSGADLSRFTQAAGMRTGALAQQAAASVEGANLRAQQQQEAEIMAREAYKGRRQAAVREMVLSELGQAASIAGSVAGMPKEARKLAFAGGRQTDMAKLANNLLHQGWSPEEVAVFQDAAKEFGGDLGAALGAAFQGDGNADLRNLLFRLQQQQAAAERNRALAGGV